MRERAYQCGLYLPGHDVHWIQARLSVEKRAERPSKPGRLIEVQPDGLVVIEVDGVVHRLWNHDTDRLMRLVARNHGAIFYQPGFGLLSTASPDGSYLFCVADADDPELRVCPTSPLGGALGELALEAGGFSMPAREAFDRVDFETDQ